MSQDPAMTSACKGPGETRGATLARDEPQIRVEALGNRVRECNYVVRHHVILNGLRKRSLPTMRVQGRDRESDETPRAITPRDG
jgi:hypothetical protein